jgi:hypothetical protein
MRNVGICGDGDEGRILFIAGNVDKDENMLNGRK